MASTKKTRRKTAAEKFLKQNGWREERLVLDRRGISRQLSRRNIARMVRTELSSAAFRNLYIKRFGFAILTAEAVEFLRPYSPVLEVGAGCGYWSYELARAGMDVVATDLSSGSYGWAKLWTTIKRFGAAAAVSKYPRRALLVVWPEYGGRWAAAALRRHLDTGGSTVIYVGEGNGGCTADDAFHRILSRQFDRVAGQRIPQFRHLHDWIEVWQRKGEHGQLPMGDGASRKRRTPLLAEGR